MLFQLTLLLQLFHITMEAIMNTLNTVAPDAASVYTVGALGSWALHIVFFVFLVNAIAMAYLCYRKEDSALLTDRMHHYVTFFFVAIATIAYWDMSSGGGSYLLKTHSSPDVYRSFFYARYIYWLCTTPLLLIDLIILGDVHAHHIARMLFAGVVMIVAGIFGATSSGYVKWGWFTFGCLAMFQIFYDLLVIVRAKAFARSAYIGKLFTTLAVMLVVVWTCFPCVWALGEGYGIVSVDVEVILYGILDLTSRVVFGWVLLLGLRRVSTEAEAAAKTSDIEGGSYASLN